MNPITRFVARASARVLPAPRRRAVLHKLARERFHAYLRRRLGTFVVDVDPGPVGDPDIIMRTALLTRADALTRLHPDHYFGSAYGVLLSWLKHLDRHRFNVRTARAILELGCGSARLIRHLRCIDGIRLVGSDVRPDFVAWCQRNVPGVDFHVNDVTPPLSFAPHDTFDLVLAQSVFTHIPLDVQEAWIAELRRVLRPGGFLMCTVLGRAHQEKMLSPEERATLRRQGHFTLAASSPRASLSTQLIGSWDVFQTRAEVLKAFGSVFEVRDYVAGELDLLILRKQAPAFCAPNGQRG